MQDSNLPLWFWVIYWVVLLINLASMWKLFIKANRPGWFSIIPIYNTVVWLQIIGRPIWWVFLYFIPVVNFVFGIIILYDFMKAYGKDNLGFFLGMLILPFVFFPILAFGSAQYVGPVANKKTVASDTSQTPPPPPPIPQNPSAM